MLSGKKLSNDNIARLPEITKANKIVSKLTSKFEQVTIENVRLRSEVDQKDSQIDLLNTEMSSIELMLNNNQG